MKRFISIIAVAAALAGCGQEIKGSDGATTRQAEATRVAMDAADREVGMPRIANFAQRKLLKNAYEDMDQTTLVYVYAQALDGRFLCLGQALGYGVSMGTQFTSPQYPKIVAHPNNHGGIGNYGIYMMDQQEPNGLFMPTSGAATIVNLVDPATGKARTSLVEPNVVTTPNKLHPGVVSVPCPGDVDPSRVSDGKEVSVARQRD